MTAAFPPWVRAAVLQACGYRCAGCGAANGVEVHHRAARRMGGAKGPGWSAPFNGLALCGAVCHPWVEAHPDAARDLGWTLHAPSPAAPFWTTQAGWLAWTLLEDGGSPCWCTRMLDLRKPLALPPQPS